MKGWALGRRVMVHRNVVREQEEITGWLEYTDHSGEGGEVGQNENKDNQRAELGEGLFGQ